MTVGPSLDQQIKAARREVARLESASERWCIKRGALPAGSSRAKVTAANAGWAAYAEARDRERERLRILLGLDAQRKAIRAFVAWTA